MNALISSILTQLLPTSSGHKIAILTLNAPAAMNAVDLEMVKSLDHHLQQWQKDPSVVAVFMHGAGDKAFSAGGDIRQLYNSMTIKDEQHLVYGDAFFVGEYSKNYRVHYFTKPLIAWGQGFVMGGGLGLFISANHRVGTETLKLAWPEIRIGLFPDVTASWWLSRLPKAVGYWMALSGSHMNAVDCQQQQLIHYCLEHQQQAQIIQGLTDLAWSNSLPENHQQVRQLLTQAERLEAMPASNLTETYDILESFVEQLDLERIAKAFAVYQGEHPWLVQGIKNFQNGCPATAHIIMRQLEQGAKMDLLEVVRWELALAYQSLRHPDFAEGIRAMVIDKDFKPRWQHKDVYHVPRQWVDEMCSSPWTAQNHPMRLLKPFKQK